MEMKETAFTNISSTFCHRTPHNFAQDAFFNKHQPQEKMSYPVVGNVCLHGRGGMQNEESDCSSFAELGSLVRMKDQIRFTLIRGQGIEIIEMICSSQEIY
jgi:hypothetical protein